MLLVGRTPPAADEGELVQMIGEAARRWPDPRTAFAASVDRPGTRRFTVASAIVAAWVAALVLAMALWSPTYSGDPADTTLGLFHPFAQPSLAASLGIVGAWLLRGWSPASGWVLLLLSLQVIAEPFYELGGMPAASILIAGLPAAMATVAALYASDPVRRLGRWVTPLAAVLVAWFWLGVVLELTQLPAMSTGLDPLPWWWDLARIPREGWIPGLLILLGLAGDGRHLWPSLRAWVRPTQATRQLTRTQRRWFTAGVTIAVGLVVAATVAMAAYAIAGGPAYGDWVPVLLAAAFAIVCAVVLRNRLRSGAWLLLWGAGYVAILLIGGFAFGPDPDWGSADVAVMTNVDSIAYGAVLLIGTLYASEPGRRLGRWVLWAGIAVTVWAVVGHAAWIAWYLASLEGPLAQPWWADSARAPVGGDLALPFLLAGPLLGIAGDLRVPVTRARNRITREHVSPTGWPGIFVDEIIPGRESGRRSAAEAERVRLAGDLHAQILPSLNLVLAESAAGASPEVLADRLRDLERDMRGIVAERRLVILEEFGIVQALEWLAERAEDRAPVVVELTVQPGVGEERPPREVERAAFRVAQLALDNALLHAEPQRVTIGVLADASHLKLRVEDDGQGLETGAPERAARANHQGMVDMRLQADLVRARLDVTSARPGGTVVIFDWAGS